MRDDGHPATGARPHLPSDDGGGLGLVPSPDERVAVRTMDGLSPTVIAMAVCQRAWAKRHAPWLVTREEA